MGRIRRGSNRVNRGGSWNNDRQNCRSANRNNNTPDNRNNNLELRLASNSEVPLPLQYMKDGSPPLNRMLSRMSLLLSAFDFFWKESSSKSCPKPPSFFLRLRLFIFLLILFFGKNKDLYSQSTSWSRQSSGTTATLRSIHFVDSTKGWTCGDSSTVLRTKDGGKNWSAQYLVPNTVLRSITGSEYNLYAVGDHGMVFKSSDGGITWRNLSSPTTEDLNVVVTRGDTVHIAGACGSYFYSLNAGQTWQNFNSSSSRFIYDLHISNSIFLANSGGEYMNAPRLASSWNKSSKPTQRSLVKLCERFSSVYALSYDAKLYQLTSNTVYTLSNTATLNSISTFGTTVFACGKAGMVRRSDDLNTWQDDRNGISNNIELHDIKMLSPTRHYAVGSEGYIYARNVAQNNGGGNSADSCWTQILLQDTSVGLYDAYLFNLDTGFVVGSKNTFLKIAKSQVTSPVLPNSASNIHLYSIEFRKNSNQAYICGSQNSIWKTTDRGNTWQKLTGPASTSYEELWDVAVDSTSGAVYVAGECGNVYHSSDGGSSWTTKSFGSLHIKKIVAYQGAYYVINSSGDIYRYNDGAKIKTISYFPLAASGNQNGLYVFGKNSTYDRLQSANWTNKNHNSSPWIRASFSSNAGLWIGGQYGKIYYQSDPVSGTFEDISIPSNHPIRSIFFIDQSNGYALGEKGSLWKYNCKKCNLIENPISKSTDTICNGANLWLKSGNSGLGSINWSGAVSGNSDSIKINSPGKVLLTVSGVNCTVK
ncbi:MAG: hypothetical protein KBA06_04285, partial [Saprospiraceae bacterium]|nr:hypothetical protein [Saprospiraceae bacterium]